MKMQRRIFSAVCGSYFALCSLGFIWPLAVPANSIEPRILGFPFFFAWNVGLVLAIFIGCAGMYAWDTALSRKEARDA